MQRSSGGLRKHAAIKVLCTCVGAPSCAHEVPVPPWTRGGAARAPGAATGAQVPCPADGLQAALAHLNPGRQANRHTQLLCRSAGTSAGSALLLRSSIRKFDKRKRGPGATWSFPGAPVLHTKPTPVLPSRSLTRSAAGLQAAMAPKKRARSDDAELAAARAAEPSTTQAADGPDRRGDMADIARR